MRDTRRTGLVAVVAAGLALALAGCDAGSGTTGRPSGSASPSPSAVPRPVTAVGHGWTATGVNGPVPREGTCHIRAAANGEPRPDPHCTPGAVDTAVTDANVDQTVCRAGYVASVTPPDRLTAALKRQLMGAYNIPDTRSQEYELDRFIPLEAGGSSDARNLWPEPNTFLRYHGGHGLHNDKDAVEAYLSSAICQHKVTASAVRAAVAADWTTAVSRLGLPPMPPKNDG